mmetsp:Transcript_51756/g.116663  ORF Transcript_51756/g.116663 Transcript_51756/m.116663 type:complete len:255 (+) Transcript_51756:2-766(+)
MAKLWLIFAYGIPNWRKARPARLRPVHGILGTRKAYRPLSASSQNKSMTVSPMVSPKSSNQAATSSPAPSAHSAASAAPSATCGAASAVASAMASPASAAPASTAAPASAAPSAMASPASAAMSAVWRSPPVRWSPSTTPPISAPAIPTVIVPASNAWAPKPHIPSCFLATSLAVSPLAGTGMASLLPTFAFLGTATSTCWPALFGSSTLMTVPGWPCLTVITIMGPAGNTGFLGAFMPGGGRIERSLPVSRLI